VEFAYASTTSPLQKSLGLKVMKAAAQECWLLQ